MTGYMLLDKKDYTADKCGKIVHGPIEDKEYLKSKITNKVVLVGYTTWKQDLCELKKFRSLPTLWLILSKKYFSTSLENAKAVKLQDLKDYNIDCCLGGTKTISLVPVDLLVVSRVNTANIKQGIKLSLKDYNLIRVKNFKQYNREYYKRTNYEK